MAERHCVENLTLRTTGRTSGRSGKRADSGAAALAWVSVLATLDPQSLSGRRRMRLDGA